MIKINLLAEGRRPVVARKMRPKLSFGGLDPSVVILALGLIVGVGVSGAWWFTVQKKLDVVEDQVRRAQREVEELKEIIAEVEAFKAKQADLKRKIDVIKDLKDKQQGPVHVMDEVSRALPELLWLTGMRLNGDLVSLRGTAFNTNAIAALIENLSRVQGFREPDTENIAQRGNVDIYDFSINFRFTAPKKPEPVEAGAAGATTATPPAGG